MNIRNFIFTTFVFALLLTACEGGSDSLGSGGDSSGGKGGSMARFTIAGDYLYTVDQQTLKTFALSNAAQPEYLDRKDQYLSFGIETIFCMDTLLFIGSQDGMYIYDIARPEFPQQLSYVSHIRSCDPVVASGNYAYVTLNSERQWCGNTSNVLNIYDISDLSHPVLKVTQSMNSPKGLGFDRNKLFVCDAVSGVKVFDVSDPLRPIWIDDWTHQPYTEQATAYDVIPIDGVLLVSADRGIFQFDYTGEQLQFLSKLNTTKE